ncbi:mitotic-spindle organizing protein 1 isoform X1 [Panthera leo]|uniref:mitotic-spindle organizing protein 1 isoform X1 n=1 Tax=Panthera leo TaxID=9689 RepID=UPI001C69B90E|nr:mitotic-spindle organizing protein 1 isoform X1 [Panthera leo]
MQPVRPEHTCTFLLWRPRRQGPDCSFFLLFLREMFTVTNVRNEVTSILLQVLLEISRILNTGLDMETLSICVRLCEQGINPEALSSVIKELRKATEALKKSPAVFRIFLAL